MKRCSCGCDMFYAKQKQECTVMIDGGREWKGNCESFPIGKICGPYVCGNCGARYKTWADVPDESEK